MITSELPDATRTIGAVSATVLIVAGAVSLYRSVKHLSRQVYKASFNAMLPATLKESVPGTMAATQVAAWRSERMTHLIELEEANYAYDLKRVVRDDQRSQYPAITTRITDLAQGQALAHLLLKYDTASLLPPTPSPVVRDHTMVFKIDEPQRLDDMIGQQHIITPLKTSIKALGPDEVVLKHKLLTGLPGFGKTLLAKIIANELQRRAEPLGKSVDFVETYAANINSIDALDAVVRSITPGQPTVWFIDEIHVLNKELCTKIYLLMEEGRYPFHGDLNPTAIPDLMIIGATTDYGMLHPALKRRFGEGLMMQPLSRDELRRMTDTLGYDISAEASKLLVDRCIHSGAPHELKTLFSECATFAKANDANMITAQIVRTVCDVYGIDDLGLRPIDRKIVTAMLARPRYRGRTQELIGYGGSENDVCLAAGVDKGEFREVIRPRLLTRGLLEVRPGIGLSLTDHALKHYAA